jgi:hypothetical protein
MMCEWFLHYDLEDASYEAHETMVYESVRSIDKGQS